MTKSFTLAFSVILAASVLPESVARSASSVSAARYRVLDLGDLEQTSSGIVRGLNSSGDIVGASAGLGIGTRALC